jgi:1-acyl-sn-glycerol-3-phosphate acyltransferase
MKKLTGRLLLVWMALCFVLTMLIFLIPIWAVILWPEPRRTDIMIKLSRAWMAMFFFFAGIRLTIRGREKFATGQNYIVVCNHNSMMDVPITSPGIPGANKTIAKKEMMKIPVFNIIYRRGSVLVDRNSDQSRRESYLRMKDVLEMGMHMCIYPEGTRNKTNKPLKEFHEGAFRLAKDTGKPIMPAVIFGTARMLPTRGGMTFRPGKLEMHFLDPIFVTDEDSAKDLKDKAFRVMWDHYEANKEHI